MPQDVKALVALGIRLAEAGRLDLARRYFAQALALDPENEEAWLWQGGLARDPRESLRCLETALAINPQSQRAKMGIQWARARLAANHLAAAAAPADDRAVSPGPAGATPVDRPAAASEPISNAPHAKGAAVTSTTKGSPIPPPPAAANRGLQALPLVAGVLVVLAILLTLSGLLGLGGLARALAPLGASAMPSSTPTLIVIPTATPAPTPTVTPTPTNDDRL
ncbi:MAG: tetratricopeptide repeat protein, partial [Chloroflexota bacterium]